MKQDVSNKSVRFGWYMYDWANSAFAVTIMAALFGPYLDKVVVPAGGYVLPFIGSRLSATSLYGYTIGLSALTVLLTSPLLGAIADHTMSKKRFMKFFCYVGCLCSLLLVTVHEGDVLWALSLFFLGNFCFISANVFYDAFLPHIAPPDEQDAVSGTGYAYGYIGGGLLFLVNLIMVQFHAQLGIAEATTAIRLSLGSVGIWWGGFSLITFSRLQEPAAAEKTKPIPAIHIGLARLRKTLGHIPALKQLLIFLLAFMIYNDGIQTVIAMSTIYGSEELHFDTLTLMGCLLMIQCVAFLGARLFAILSARFGTKQMVLASLVIWSLVVIFAYSMTKPIEFWILGAITGLVLGGSQALSRSLYSRIIPARASAEFFGFFSMFEKFSSIWGPIAFALIRQLTGSSRYSIIALLVFFIAGFLILLLLDMKKAEKDSVELEALLGVINNEQ